MDYFHRRARVGGFNSTGVHDALINTLTRQCHAQTAPAVQWMCPTPPPLIPYVYTVILAPRMQAIAAVKTFSNMLVRPKPKISGYHKNR